MLTRAKHYGAAGVIIDGRMRDTQEHRKHEFSISKPKIALRSFRT